jgi:MFS family permease
MTMHASAAGVGPSAEIESSYAWLRLAAALALGTIGSIGMWSFVVALPAVQAAFGVARADASLPFTLTMMGFGFGGVVMGRFADRYGIVWPVVIGALALGAGYALSGVATTITQFALAQGLIGLGSSATFGPLMSDISHWFARGAACGRACIMQQVSPARWPPIVQFRCQRRLARASCDRPPVRGHDTAA